MPNKKYSVTISDVAEQMISDHIKFLARVSEKAAIKLKDKIIQELKELEDIPEIYPFLNDEVLPENYYHKKVIDKRYVIIYKIKDDNVYICRKNIRY